MSDEVSHEMQLEWAELEKELDWTWMQDVDWPAFEAETSAPCTGKPTDEAGQLWWESPLLCPDLLVSPLTAWTSGFPSYTPSDGCDHMTPLLEPDTQHHHALGEFGVATLNHEDYGPQAIQRAAQLGIPKPPDAGQQSPIGYNDTASSRTTYHCTVDGCNYKGIFTRPAELQRHINTKHSHGKPFVCTVSGCFRGQQPPAFARPDKLTAHIRARHPLTKLASCPKTTCSIQLPLILLGVHTHLRHCRKFGGDTRVEQSEHLASLAVHHASDTSHTRCPYLGCGRKLRLLQFADHILSHSFGEQMRMEHDLRELNYVFVRGHRAECPSGGSEDQSGLEDRSHQNIELRIKCPVCGQECDDHFDFATHLMRSHIVQDSFEARSRFDTFRKKGEASNAWIHPNWHSLQTWLKDAMLDARRRCNLCNKTYGSCQCKMPPLLAENDIIRYLRPHRIQILQLFPGFGSLKPIFEDII